MATENDDNADLPGDTTADPIKKDKWYTVEDCIPLQKEPPIYVKILSIKGGKVTLGIDAPKDVPVSRGAPRPKTPFRKG
jgi:hypothetical protein